MEHYRFAYEYENPKDILKGLQQFKETHEFVNKDELNPDAESENKRETINEDSNCRKQNLHQ